MRQTKLVIVAAVLILSATNSVFAQGTDPLYEQVKAQFNARFGSRFELDVFVNVDSSLGRPLGTFNNYRIEDPYGTLAHCIIFTGVGKWEEGYRPPAFIGVYRGGQFLWFSDTLVYYYAISFNGMVQATDLNNDGKVEIALGMSGGSHTELEYLWIVSWDGYTGTILNDAQGDKIDGYKSKIAGFFGSFEFHDLNGDGVKEIISTWYASNESKETAKVIYSWNGQKYGKWGGGPQFPASGYLARNRLTATAKAMVVKMPDAYRYQYIIQNSSTSQQEVNEVLVAARTDSIRNTVGPERWEFFALLRPKVDWVLPPFLRQYIPPGASDSRFSYESTGLPAPVSCYVRGRNETLQKLPPYDEQKWYADVAENSFVSTTVGAADPPVPFIHSAFLDTLLSYTRQSVELGWLGTRRDDDCDDDERPDDGITKNIDKRLEKAKKELSKGDSTKARKELEKLVDKVERTWKRSQEEEKKHKGEQRQRKEEVIMTSEAYALLKYNTEYLIDRLPSEKKKSKK